MNDKKWYAQPEKKSYFSTPKSRPIKGLLTVLIMVLLLFGCITWFNAHSFKVKPGEVRIAVLDTLPPRVIRSPGLHFNISLDYTVSYKKAYRFGRELSCRLNDANLIKVNIMARYTIPIDDSKLLEVNNITGHNPNKLLKIITSEMQKAIFIGCAQLTTKEVTAKKMVNILDSFEQFIPGTITQIIVMPLIKDEDI